MGPVGPQLMLEGQDWAAESKLGQPVGTTSGAASLFVIKVFHQGMAGKRKGRIGYSEGPQQSRSHHSHPQHLVLSHHCKIQKQYRYQWRFIVMGLMMMSVTEPAKNRGHDY